VEQEWVDRIADDWPAVHAVIEAAKITYGEDMAAFLCFLGVRLMEMHRVLADDGSIYLHIDHTAHAYVKTLMDAIFGKANFRNEIVWCYAGGGNR
jgi:site-specific DNA-methyltransferase (adenine-specific)